jgi:hypothetical protein
MAARLILSAAVTRERRQGASFAGEDQVNPLVGRSGGELAAQDAARGGAVALRKLGALTGGVDLGQGPRGEESPHQWLGALVVAQEQPLHLPITEECGPRGQRVEPHGVTMMSGDEPRVSKAHPRVLEDLVDHRGDRIEAQGREFGILGEEG